jgi:DNA-binding MarR family transcriptional regulator
MFSGEDEAMTRRTASKDGRRRTPRPAARMNGVAPATPPLGAALEFLRSLWGVNHALESSSRKMKSRLGVTGPERMVVRLVGRCPEISAGDLARILQVHPSTLTGLLKRLVIRKFLVRAADAGDGRKALFSLTSRGQVADRVKTGTVEAAVGVTLKSVSQRDVRATATVLEALQRTLEEAGTDPL